jgi:hypothetical protein
MHQSIPNTHPPYFGHHSYELAAMVAEVPDFEILIGPIQF